MAKSKVDKRFRDELHARGLRKKVAGRVAGTIGSGGRRTAPKAITRVSDELRELARDIEDRATGGPAKRRSAGRKAARTRARTAEERSRAARKGARTRAANKQRTSR